MWGGWNTSAGWVDWVLWRLTSWVDWVLWGWGSAGWVGWDLLGWLGLDWVGWDLLNWLGWLGWGLDWALVDGDGDSWDLWDQGGWVDGGLRGGWEWGDWVWDGDAASWDPWGNWVLAGWVGWDWDNSGGDRAVWAVGLLWSAGGDGLEEGGVLGLGLWGLLGWVLLSWVLWGNWGGRGGDDWVRGHGDNGRLSWAVLERLLVKDRVSLTFGAAYGDSWSARSDGDLLGDVEGRSSHGAGGHDGEGSNGELHFD